MPAIQDQYVIGPEVMEIRDPSVEEEEAYRIAHLPPSAVLPAGNYARTMYHINPLRHSDFIVRPSYQTAAF